MNNGPCERFKYRRRSRIGQIPPVWAQNPFKAAAAGADWSKSFYQILTNQPGKDSWPISGATFILMHAKQDKPAAATEVLKFFNWAYANGSKTAAELDYVPMPASVVTAIQKSWADIKDDNGRSIAFK
jgi:phosphate transport system substrate-binding protein